VPERRGILKSLPAEDGRCPSEPVHPGGLPLEKGEIKQPLKASSGRMTATAESEQWSHDRNR